MNEEIPIEEVADMIVAELQFKKWRNVKAVTKDLAVEFGFDKERLTELVHEKWTAGWLAHNEKYAGRREISPEGVVTVREPDVTSSEPKENE